MYYISIEMTCLITGRSMVKNLFGKPCHIFLISRLVNIHNKRQHILIGSGVFLQVLITMNSHIPP